jgi:hypothetical protein
LIYAAASSQNFSNAQGQSFLSNQYSDSASIELDGRIDQVFPLFGAFAERKWAEGWNPKVIYPEKEEIRLGTVFQTAGHVPGEPDMIWTVTRLDAGTHDIQYFIYSTNRVVILDINCRSVSGGRTDAKITYTFTGLDADGNKISQHLLKKIYGHRLADWREAINKYLNSEK